MITLSTHKNGSAFLNEDNISFDTLFVSYTLQKVRGIDFFFKTDDLLELVWFLVPVEHEIETEATK